MRLKNQSGRKGRGIEEKYFENLLLWSLTISEYTQREEDGIRDLNIRYFFSVANFKSFLLEQFGRLAMEGMYRDFFEFISSNGKFERVIFRFSKKGILEGNVIKGFHLFALTPYGLNIARKQIVDRKIIYSNN